MKKLFLACGILMLCGISCFAQKSGVILKTSNYQLGKYSQYTYLNNGDKSVNAETTWKPTIGFNLGYQFNFHLTNRFSIDAAILAGLTKGNVTSYTITNNETSIWNLHKWFWNSSISGNLNYRIWNGLYAGLGIEPTIYFNTNKFRGNKNNNLFDCPILVSLGYEFKNSMKLAAFYKQGFKSIYETKASSNSKNNKEIGISLFIPIFK